MALSKELYVPVKSGYLPEVIKLWILRILVPLKANVSFVSNLGYSDDQIAYALGLKQWGITHDFNEKNACIELKTNYRKIEQKNIKNNPASCLSKNIQNLAQIAGLTTVDCQILEFATWAHNDVILENATELLGNLNAVKAINALSKILDIPEQEIRSALTQQGALIKSGLISFDRSQYGSLKDKLNLLSCKFAVEIFSSEADPVSLIQDIVTVSSPPKLSLSDYKHITPILAILIPYLKQSLKIGKSGVNIFLYGVPGTGKTQLAKVLARELACQQFEVASCDEDGEPLNGEKRLLAYRAAQSFLSSQNSIILFDEVEDVFNDGNDIFTHQNTNHTGKALMNKILEENAIPTLWLSNSVDSMDPAYIRRFDMIFELPIPPRNQRKQIIKDACGKLISEESLGRISLSESLAPAIVTRVASVVETIQYDLKSKQHSEAIELLINQTLASQGHPPIIRNCANKLPELYDPIFIHADADLAQIAKGLIQSQSGRICLYGPPGTGKTAYGRWLSEQLGKPIIVKRASDLMSMWVGGNEKNIANAFKQAEQENALLLIDEVDSFLQDRRDAQRGWEASLVNEMLTQIESFSGVFVASTNLMHGLDQAALRRFDLKVKFDYLKSLQAWMLLIRYCNQLQIPNPQKLHRVRLNHMLNLTPGDFAAVARQHTFRPVHCSSAFIDALAMESNLKEGVKSSMGFL